MARGRNFTKEEWLDVKTFQRHGYAVYRIMAELNRSERTIRDAMRSETYEEFKTVYCGTHGKKEQEATKEEPTKEEPTKEERETPAFEIVEKSDWDAMIRFFKRLADNTNGIDDNMHKVAERQDKIWNVVLALDKKIETVYTKLETVCKELGV